MMMMMMVIKMIIIIINYYCYYCYLPVPFVFALLCSLHYSFPLKMRCYYKNCEKNQEQFSFKGKAENYLTMMNCRREDLLK